MTKKIRLSLVMGALVATAAPLATMACGSTSGGTYGYVATQGPDADYSAKGTHYTVANGGVALVTDGGVVNDKSFNEQAFDALKLIDSSVTPTTTSRVIQPTTHDSSSIAAGYTTAAGVATNKMILAPGFYHHDAIESHFDTTPNSNMRFIFVDGVFAHANVASIIFKTQEPAFIAGYMAGEYLKTNDATPEHGHKVGTFGGGNFPGVTDFMKGFVDGVRYWNDHGNNGKPVAAADRVTFAKFGTDDAYTNTGFGVGGGAAAASKLLSENADIILPVAGPQTQDVIDAIKSSGKTNKAWIVGVDTNQSEAYPSEAGMFFTSIEKKLKDGFKKVYDATQSEAALAAADVNGYNATTFGKLSNGLVGLSQPNVTAAQSIYASLMAATPTGKYKDVKEASQNNGYHAADWANALNYIKAN